MTALLNKPLPNCEETERMTIGESLLAGTLTGNLLNVSTTDFYNSQFQILWIAICELHEEQQTFTVLDVWQMVKDNSKFSLKLSDVTNLTRDIPVTFASSHNLNRLKELSVKRQALRSLTQLQTKIWDNADLAEITTHLDSIQQQIVSVKSEKVNFQSMAQVLTQEVYPRLDKFVLGESNRIPLGFPLLDEATLDGIGTSELWIMAALTSEGKSAFALQVARQMAERGVSVGCISREMQNYENGFRAMSQYGKFNNGLFRANLAPHIAEQLKDLGSELEVLPMYFDDKTNNVKDLKRNVSIMIDKVGLQVLFIDYLQLLQSSSRENRQAKLEEIVNDLKDFAMQKEIGIVLLSQFNREANKTDSLPKISDLDGASAIEKAGNVILLWKLKEDIETEFYGENDRYSRQFRRGDMKIAKGRHTAHSDFSLKFFGAETRFEIF